MSVAHAAHIRPQIETAISRCIIYNIRRTESGTCLDVIRMNFVLRNLITQWRIRDSFLRAEGVSFPLYGASDHVCASVFDALLNTIYTLPSNKMSYIQRKKDLRGQRPPFSPSIHHRKFRKKYVAEWFDIRCLLTEVYRDIKPAVIG
jgi:hypothetical protein